MKFLRMFLGFSGLERLDQLDAAAGEAWLEVESLRVCPKRKRTIGARALNKRRGALAAFGRWLHRSRRFPRDPFLGLPTRNERTDRRLERRSLTFEEVTDLLGQVGSPALFERRVVYLAALLTGLRRAELGALLWEDLDLERTELTVRAQVAKNRKTATLPIVEPALSGLRELRSRRLAGEDTRPPRGNYGRPLPAVETATGSSTACRQSRRSAGTWRKPGSISPTWTFTRSGGRARRSSAAWAFR